MIHLNLMRNKDSIILMKMQVNKLEGSKDPKTEAFKLVTPFK